MRDVLHGGLTLAAAFLVHAVLGGFLASSFFGLDAFLVAVLLFAIVKGDVPGAIMGPPPGFFPTPSPSASSAYPASPIPRPASSPAGSRAGSTS